LQYGYSSHIVFVPLISIYLIWSGRKNIFSSAEYAVSRGVQVIIIGLLAAFGALLIPSDATDFLIVLSTLLLIVGGFIGFFGATSARRAFFPLGILILMLPLPGIILEKMIGFLQSQSAELTYWMFTALHVPVLRDGFVLSFPGVTIEVARECSGINYSVALLILMILFAHETLRSNWRRLILVLLVVPFSIVKNAIRIVTLTMLSIKVDPGFLTGRLHHEGGFVFFLIALGLMFPLWKILQKGENRDSADPSNQTAQSSYASANR
jgi:exosortase